MYHTVSLPFSRSHGSFFISHGFTNFAWIFPNTQFLWKQAQAVHSNAAEGHISSMINKNKADNCNSPSLSWALLFIILVKTILITHFNVNNHQTSWKLLKYAQPNIIDNFLVSKYWSIMAVFQTVDFCPWRFCCRSFKTKAVSCDNIQTTLWKTFKSKYDTNFFEITLSSSSYVFLGVFPLFWGVAPGMNLKWWWCLLYACIDLLQSINIRNCLPEDVLQKTCPLYIRGPSRKTKRIY